MDDQAKQEAKEIIMKRKKKVGCILRVEEDVKLIK